MRNFKESELQKSCVRWFRYQYSDKALFAIPNGGRRGKIEAAVMKGEGVLAGVADLFLAHPSKSFHGLFIEMKSVKGKQTEFQKDFEQKVRAQGYEYAVCHSFEELQTTVNKYLSIRQFLESYGITIYETIK
jgi:hypothetical protein